MSEPNVYLVDDDADVRDSVRALLESCGFVVADFASAAQFLAFYKDQAGCCLVTDIRMPDMDGLELQETLVARKAPLPTIIMTGHGDVPLAVRAMKAGAVDFIEEPFDDERLISSVRGALEMSQQTINKTMATQQIKKRIDLLTPRELDVLRHLVSGATNKAVAYKLDISPRTVEVHRGHVMEKMQARNLPDLVRAAMVADISDPAAGTD